MPSRTPLGTSFSWVCECPFLPSSLTLHFSCSRQHELEQHVNFLLVKCTSRNEVVRTKVGLRRLLFPSSIVSSFLRRMLRLQAIQYLGRLSSRYPYIQWSKRCLSVLLDLLHVIENTLDTDSLVSGAKFSKVPCPLVLALLLPVSSSCLLCAFAAQIDLRQSGFAEFAGPARIASIAVQPLLLRLCFLPLRC
jgi:hypothetical protein